MVLGERHLFILDGNGRCQTQVKLDFFPAGIAIMPTPSPVTGVNYHVLVAANTGMMLIYRGPELVWGAKGQLVPAHLEVSQLATTDGLILAADDKVRR